MFKKETRRKTYKHLPEVMRKSYSTTVPTLYVPNPTFYDFHVSPVTFKREILIIKY